MASNFSRFIIRTTSNKISSLKSATKTSTTTTTAASSSPRIAPPTRSASSSTLRRFAVSRTPSELGCVLSMLPLHSAVAAARMESCLSLLTGCRALIQDEIDGT